MLLDDAGPAERAKRGAAINDYLRDTLELFRTSTQMHNLLSLSLIGRPVGVPFGATG